MQHYISLFSEFDYHITYKTNYLEMYSQELVNFCNSYKISFKCLLLGRKVMTNLDSILKSRDITLPTKVRLVKAVVFPVVMYGCESWTVKKAER